MNNQVSYLYAHSGPKSSTQPESRLLPTYLDRVYELRGNYDVSTSTMVNDTSYDIRFSYSNCFLKVADSEESERSPLYRRVSIGSTAYRVPVYYFKEPSRLERFHWAQSSTEDQLCALITSRVLGSRAGGAPLSTTEETCLVRFIIRDLDMVDGAKVQTVERYN